MFRVLDASPAGNMHVVSVDMGNTCSQLVYVQHLQPAGIYIYISNGFRDVNLTLDGVYLTAKLTELLVNYGWALARQ